MQQSAGQQRATAGSPSARHCGAYLQVQAGAAAGVPFANLVRGVADGDVGEVMVFFQVAAHLNYITTTKTMPTRGHPDNKEALCSMSCSLQHS